jgi:hypothetical protein
MNNWLNADWYPRLWMSHLRPSPNAATPRSASSKCQTMQPNQLPTGLQALSKDKVAIGDDLLRW